MKPIKAIIATVLVFVIGFGILSILNTVYNRQIFDMTYSYEYAIVNIPGYDLITGKVESWRDFDDGDQIQVKIEGVTYLTHFANVVLISE